MSNVVTSLARKLTARRADPSGEARHRRAGWFDEHDAWHDSESETPELVDGAPAR